MWLFQSQTYQQKSTRRALPRQAAHSDQLALNDRYRVVASCGYACNVTPSTIDARFRELISHPGSVGNRFDDLLIHPICGYRSIQQF